MKDFIPNKQALELKELGFDEAISTYYSYPDNELGYTMDAHNRVSVRRNSQFGYAVSAPTFSQAFRWFREKYGLRASITDFIDDKIGIEWDYEIAVIGTDLDENGNYKPLVDYSTDDENRKFKTYEEAELACLKKLIEICKNK